MGGIGEVKKKGLKGESRFYEAAKRCYALHYFVDLESACPFVQRPVSRQSRWWCLGSAANNDGLQGWC